MVIRSVANGFSLSSRNFECLHRAGTRRPRWPHSPVAKSRFLVWLMMLCLVLLQTLRAAEPPQAQKQLSDKQRKELLAEAERLEEEANQLFAAEKFHDAEHVFGQRLEIVTRVFGPGDWRVTNTQLEIDKARRLQHLSAEDLTRWQSVKDAKTKADKLLRLGKYAEAVPFAITACEGCGRLFGTQHPDYATRLNDLAWIYELSGKYSKAEPLYLEARDIRKKVLGSQHPDYATGLNNLAGALLFEGGVRQGRTAVP